MELDKAIIICVVLIFAIVAISNFDNGYSQSRGGFTLYNNTNYGVQFLYPKNWIVIEGDDTPGDFQTDVAIAEPQDEQGKHFSKKFSCGEVCFFIAIDNSLESQGLSLQQYSDVMYNEFKKGKGFKLLNFNSEFKIGDKKAFEILFQIKQGNREYVERLIGTDYGENNYIYLQFKSRTKFSDQMLPLGKTMIDSFKTTDVASKR